MSRHVLNTSAVHSGLLSGPEVWNDHLSLCAPPLWRRKSSKVRVDSVKPSSGVSLDVGVTQLTPSGNAVQAARWLRLSTPLARAKQLARRGRFPGREQK